MSIKTTPTTEITLDSTELEAVIGHTVKSAMNKHCVDATPYQDMTAIKKEYSIVGDAFYAGVNSDVAPGWLVDLIDDVVETSVGNGLTDYDLLVQDVRNAIDSIDVASNTYVEEINFSERVDGIVGVHLETLNATYDGKYATIVNLDVVEANLNYAMTLSATDLRAEFSEEINSRITSVEMAYSSADESLANSVTSLTTAFADQESNLAGTANAVSGLQTYVGLDHSTTNPNGFGLLARVGVLENQNDGVVEYLSGTYDVMIGVDVTNDNTDDDKLITDALPYVLWTNMTGTGVPSGSTRAYMNYDLSTPAQGQTNILENTFYIREDFTDENTDKYYKYVNSVWNSVTAAEYFNGYTNLRSAHIADVYIQYSNEQNGGKTYLKSYKFIKTEPDDTSPYSTDVEGFGWALVTDTDSQAIYALALEAKAMADGKISHFYAWGTNPPINIYANPRAPFPTPFYPQDYDIVTGDPEYKDGEGIETIDGDNVIHVFVDSILYRKGGTWSSKSPVPGTSGSGSFMAEGDMLTVFDPSTGDNTTYWYNGSSWQQNGPAGIVSKSKWFVDLDNAVNSPQGHVATSQNELKVESETYANNVGLGVENRFAYNSVINIGGRLYESGFGLTSFGTTQIGTDSTTGDPVFGSTFRVNAESFILTNPAYPEVEAKFNVTGEGLLLSVDQTEATRNSAEGEHSESRSYLSGDIVTYEGSSYLAIRDVAKWVSITSVSDWQLLAEKGISGGYTDFLFTRKTSTPLDPGDSDEWFSDVSSVPSGEGDLWSIKKVVDSYNAVTYSDKRIIDSPIIKEITIYSNATTETQTSPIGSTYNLTTGTLNINDADWGRSVPGLEEDGQKVYACTALVEGNNTETVNVSWSSAVVYSQRVDGKTSKGLSLLATAQAFNTYQSGLVSPSSITFTAEQQNSTDNVSWSTSPYVPLSGSGNSRTLTSSGFGSNSSVKVTVEADGISDTITIVKLVDGKDAVVGYLTNENHTVPANSSGVVTSYSGANGSFKVFEGTQDVTNTYRFSKYSGSGLLWSDNSKVFISASAGTFNCATGALPNNVDAGSVIFKATREGSSDIYKTFTLSKSKQGATGPENTTPGPSGSRGPASLTYATGTLGNYTPDYLVTHYQHVITNLWGYASGGSPDLASKVEGDTLVVSNYSGGTYGDWSHIFTWSGSRWSALIAQRFAGSVVVDGTLHGNALSSSTTIIAGSTTSTAAMNGSRSGTNANYGFWAGNTNAYVSSSNKAPFRVTKNGVLIAEEARITGEIHATSGTFSGNLSGAEGNFSGDVTGSSFNGLRIKIGSFASTSDKDQTFNVNTYEGRVYNKYGSIIHQGATTPGFSALVGVTLSHIGPSTSTRDMNFPRIASSSSFVFNRDDGYSGTQYFSYMAYGI